MRRFRELYYIQSSSFNRPTISTTAFAGLSDGRRAQSPPPGRSIGRTSVGRLRPVDGVEGWVAVEVSAAVVFGLSQGKIAVRARAGCFMKSWSLARGFFPAEFRLGTRVRASARARTATQTLARDFVGMVASFANAKMRPGEQKEGE